MSAWYNENDPYVAEWLRNLITAGHIAPGVVDERSIEDVFPDDLHGFTQCHFFAGIGVWSYALRQAGWDDSRPVWTGSCPCQPFSDAGKGAGFADERHLWPALYHLVTQHRPPVFFGEQVASKDAMPWLDLVQDDMEAVGYAFGAIPFPAASVGAPHIRDRLYWVADEPSNRRGQERSHAGRIAAGNRAQGRATGLESGRVSGLLGNAGNEGLALGVGFPGVPGGSCGADAGQAFVGAGVHAGELADCGSQRWIGREGFSAGREYDGADAGWVEGNDGLVGLGKAGDASRRASPTNGFWRAADWLRCTDDRWRPVEPGTFPLVAGVVDRVGRVRADQERLAALAPRKGQGNRIGRLRGYGNAINAEAAISWIEAYDLKEIAA
jgi:DNA (cytosine-5)-methyltransferase 1